jgi:mannose-6-phosphate isomerase-like protein (cupin superfamily)
VRMSVLASAEQTGDKYEFFLLEGSGPAPWVRPLHTHPWDEAFFVLEGEVEFKLGGGMTLLTSGGFVNVPGNTAHDFRLASEKVRLLVFTTEGAASKFFADLAQGISAMPPDRAVMGAIMARHGVKPVMPSVPNAS